MIYVEFANFRRHKAARLFYITSPDIIIPGIQLDNYISKLKEAVLPLSDLFRYK